MEENFDTVYILPRNSNVFSLQFYTLNCWKQLQLHSLITLQLTS